MKGKFLVDKFTNKNLCASQGMTMFESECTRLYIEIVQTIIKGLRFFKKSRTKPGTIQFQ